MLAGDDMPETKSKHKTKQVGVRMTEEEYELLQDAAKRAGMSLADYCRMLLISPSVKVLTYKMGDEPFSIYSGTADILAESIERQKVLKTYGESEG